MAAIDVLVCGAAGRMGSEVVRAIHGERSRTISKEEDLSLVGAVDKDNAGKDVGEVAGIGPLGVSITSDLASAISSSRPKVMVDFTVPAAVMSNLRLALENKVACVVGTTGLAREELDEVAQLCRDHNTPALVAPNFAIGAVLMMEFAARAARFFPRAEIIELHHDKKLDAPSGTALLTAQKMAHADGCTLEAEPVGETPPPRGQLVAGKVRIHSVRLPGLVAHQQVVFGGLGQTLTLRHDSLSRESFMPGVVLAVRQVLSLKGLTIGLEHLL
ncbi:MAG: 4-hydroxy-tetrahydrodipicolinate reductase [Armatimonadetes bacterium]|nr:4-hydroxy-tetrahydrodipicolinate reductase [Armatimonadota bacterium]NIM23608.1 4-hydroxy-tetrahydrodipicolinate reductase [Armatimonadota bacterium]NIM67474.1 4-hydroxy-tetrahydrodipicolinate reductase [Armatimonadota bacterium]NIM75971.1 4-hydroxy-tetrahydrodipicolinate reductase [Armatimonadota bacterium]NIN05660.1 4-hydroxy-tetrahydrodipicolinate reductase [Armatimonadota bacterium]